MDLAVSEVAAVSPLWKYVEPRVADHLKLRVKVRREQMRIAVRWFMAHRAEMLRRNLLPGDASHRQVMKMIRYSRKRCFDGHWTFNYDRHLALRQCYVGIRYARLLEVAKARRAS